MNPKVEEYIDGKLEKSKKKLLKDLEISRVYQDEDIEKGCEYPYIDYAKGKRYRCEDIEITDEEYFKLLKYATLNDEPVKQELSISGWYAFGIVFIILCFVIGFSLIMLPINYGIIIGLCIILFGILGGTIIILLSKIDFQLRKLNYKK